MSYKVFLVAKGESKSSREVRTDMKRGVRKERKLVKEEEEKEENKKDFFEGDKHPQVRS